MTRIGTILVVDDEKTLREVVRRYLELEGFHVLEAASGDAALDHLAAARPDLIVLDVMLPGTDGFALARRIHSEMPPNTPPIPIIFLTARKDEMDRIAGFELGADDYVTKPFSPRELVARVRAVLRRSGGLGQSEMPLELGRLMIDPRSRTVTVATQSVSLTAKEFDLLWFLARHPQQVFSRTQLLDNVWGYEFYGDESTVTVHIRRLREKIEPNASKPTYIQTVWGIGYKFEAGD
jgi:two-component system, OmpR family, response regulator ResD